MKRETKAWLQDALNMPEPENVAAARDALASDAEVKRLRKENKDLVLAATLQSAALTLWLAPHALGRGPTPQEMYGARDATRRASDAFVAALKKPKRKR